MDAAKLRTPAAWQRLARNGPEQAHRADYLGGACDESGMTVWHKIMDPVPSQIIATETAEKAWARLQPPLLSYRSTAPRLGLLLPHPLLKVANAILIRCWCTKIYDIPCAFCTWRNASDQDPYHRGQQGNTGNVCTHFPLGGRDFPLCCLCPRVPPVASEIARYFPFEPPHNRTSRCTMLRAGTRISTPWPSNTQSPSA